MKNGLVLFAILAFTGCASNYYRPYNNGIGYSEVNVAKDRYEIIYYGAADQDELNAKKYAIVRAAEVGKQNKFAYFKIGNSREHEQTSTEVIREKQFDNFGHPYGWRRDPWGHTEEIITTRVEKKPVVKITVTYLNEDCNDCLSVDDKIKDGVSEGIIKP